MGEVRLDVVNVYAPFIPKIGLLWALLEKVLDPVRAI